MKMETKSKSNYAIIFSHAKGLKRFFSIAAIATTLRVIINFLTPQVIRVTVDSVIGDKPMEFMAPVMRLIDMVGGRPGLRENIWLCAIVVLLLAVVTCVCDYIGRVTISKGCEGIIMNVRDGLYSHIQKLPYSWHIKNQTGDIVQRATSDVEVVRNFINSQLMQMFRTIMLIVIAMVLMFSMNYRLSLIVLIFVPIIMAYSGIFYGILSKRFLVADQAEGQLFSTAQENLTGVRVVRAFGRESFEIDKFSGRNRKFSDLWVRLGYQLGYYWGIGDLVTGFQVMVIICLGVSQAVNGTITLGEFLAFVSYNSMLAWPVRSFGRILGELSKTKVSLNRICEILKEPEEGDEPDNVTPDMNKDIVYSHVTFGYEGSPVVEDVSFTIKAGSTFAILGGTGSGKTTLMHLLNRLYDLPEGSGTITIGGVKVNDIKRDYLRSSIGMVLQEPFLFSRTVKENINITRPEANFDEIREISGIAHVDEAIDSFTLGYDTVVGERGVTLSGGQKQRVAIARMLMQRTPIMVFDDSLSAVDAETDAKIRADLKKMREQATTILISHRITTLMQADMILVLDKGRVSDMGTHQELISRDGIYKSIYEVQTAMDAE